MNKEEIRKRARPILIKMILGNPFILFYCSLEDLRHKARLLAIVQYANEAVGIHKDN